MTFLVQGGVTPDNSVSTVKIQNNAVDETKLKDALVADFTEVTVVAGDGLLIGDASDSGNTKRDTVQGILDLAGGSEYFHVYQSSAQSIANATLTLLDFGTETFDTGSNFNISTDKYIVPSAGKYWIGASVGISSHGDGKEIITRIKNDSTTIMEMRLSAGVADNDPISFIAGIFVLAADDEITFSVQHDNGSSKDTRSGAENTYFCGYKIGA